MDLRLRRRALAAVLLLPAAGCALQPPEPAAADACQASYLALDARVAAAGVRNAGGDAITGFPYLRADRFLASFRHEVKDGPAFDAWVERLRRFDLQARAPELRNLGWDDPREELEHLDRCSREWAARDGADPRRRALLRENAAVPDDYSVVRRALGAYPLTVLFLNLGIRDFNAQVGRDYARPLEQLDAAGPLVLWEPGAAAAPAGAAHGRDLLGIPLLQEDQWRALAAAHAPRWLVETAGDFDRIGAPVPGQGAPTVDAARPVTYFLPAYTRLGDAVLAQLVYVAWFSARPKSDVLDPYGGALDGIVWRVTLDTDGVPLLYDTIHACGCYHYYYLPARGAERLRRRPAGGYWQEPVLFPQPAPAAPFAIRVQSGTHYVRRLVPLESVSASRVALYAQAAYDELLSLPDGAGRRSLFAGDGIAPGTARLERFFLWPAGIKSAGAMRQWGRHATSFVGRSHFDEPFMLDRLFQYVTPQPQ